MSAPSKAKIFDGYGTRPRLGAGITCITAEIGTCGCHDYLSLSANSSLIMLMALLRDEISVGSDISY